MSNIKENEVSQKNEFALDAYSNQQELALAENQAISTPISQRNMNHFLLNLIIPGLGSLAQKKKTIGMLQLIATLGGAISCYFLGWTGLWIILGTYLWSIGTGISFLKEKKGPLVW